MLGLPLTALLRLRTEPPPLGRARPEGTREELFDEEPPVGPAAPTLESRLERLGASPGRAAEIAGAVAMSPPREPELVGHNDSVLRLNAPDVETEAFAEE